MSSRLPWIDTARGGALVAMAAYHFTWDLAEFRWIDGAIALSRGFHFFGHAIAASFLLLSGYSLVLARRARGQPLWRDPRYWRRWGRIAAAAAGAVTLASLWLFPEAPIWFGILHCIALSSLIALPFVEAPVVAAVLAAALALAAPLAASHAFDAPLWLWTGLSATTPASNDYRPLLPWLGFVLLGVALARLPLPARAKGEASRPLAVLGRHSLAFYLIHQPILYGALALIGPQAAPSMEEAAFRAQCVAQCSLSDATPGRCEASCGCVLARAKAAGRWPALVSGALTAAQKTATHDDAVSCYAETAR